MTTMATSNLALATAAREILAASDRGATIYEDFSYRGMSAQADEWNEYIADLYYSWVGGDWVVTDQQQEKARSFLQRVIATYSTRRDNLVYTDGNDSSGSAVVWQVAPTPLVEGQYELLSPISSFLFGEGNTGIRVEETDFGSAEMRTDDTEAPLRDGMRQGRDFYSGRTITFTINVKPRRGMGSALDLTDEMAAAWSGDDSRDVAESYYILRNRRGGRTRRTYGRPRKFAAVSKLSTRGWVPVTCTFDCVTHQFYGDDLNSVTAKMPQDTSMARTRWPIRWPLRPVEPVTSPAAVAHIRGTRKAWPVFQIKAPQGITDPILDLDELGEVPLRARLDPGQSLIIDSRPWSEGVWRSDGVYLPGALINSPPLHRWGMPKGDYTIKLKGTDPSRTAFVQLQWYETYANF